MTDFSSVYENPNWLRLQKYALGGPNGGDAYKRWPQGSIGMNSPMPLYSNEYQHLYMKHGQNGLQAYHGGIKEFAPSADRALQTQVHECSNLTLNSAGCQQAAISKVYSVDAHHTGMYHPHQKARSSPVTPHPFSVSYQLGYVPQQFPQPAPWGPQN